MARSPNADFTPRAFTVSEINLIYRRIEERRLSVKEFFGKCSVLKCAAILKKILNRTNPERPAQRKHLGVLGQVLDLKLTADSYEIFFATLEKSLNLPRSDGDADRRASEHEKRALTYLASIGGRSPVLEFRQVSVGLNLPVEKTIEALEQRGIIRVIDDDDGEHLQLTAHGQQEAQALFRDEKSQSQDRVRRCGEQYHNILPEQPRSSQRRFDQLRSRKDEILALVSTACKVGDMTTVKLLRRVASWLLLMDHAYEKRIEFGTLILRSFNPEVLAVDWGWTMVDDLGWSYVLLNMLEKGKQSIEKGIEGLWRYEDMYGVCQGWRHLQAIKARKGDFVGARFCLRLVFGASCAIPDVEDRLEMQAGILRALEKTCRRQGQTDASTKYRELGDLLSQKSGNAIHFSPDSPPVVLPQREAAVKTADEATLLLLRHPLAANDQKRAFGLRPSAAAAKVGSPKVAEFAGRVHAIVGVRRRNNAKVYSAPTKGVRLLAQGVAAKCGWSVKMVPALASIDAGSRTGSPEEEAPELSPGLMAQLKEYKKNQLDLFTLEFPGGETLRDATKRIARFLVQTVYAGSIPEVCVIAAQGSSIFAILNILATLDRLPKDASHQYYDVPIASLTRISIDPLHGWVAVKN